MGLDMYLYGVRYCAHRDWVSEEENKRFDKVVDIMEANSYVSENPGYTSAYVKLEIAYWRKANAIHNYFVQNCANGQDDCKPVYVEREDLENLLKICDELLETKDVEKAKELLPTQGGFFFGPTEYDSYYFVNLECTQRMLTKVLKESPEDWEFEYRASW